MPNLSLQPHHIVNLYVWVDDLIPETPKPNGGHPLTLRDSEVITILIWNALILRQKTIKDLHRSLAHCYSSEFPLMLGYEGFLKQCHRVTPLMLFLLQQLLQTTAPVRLMDSTMVPVCRNHRVANYRVAKEVTGWGKNWQGFHYGFKLHISVNPKGQLCGLALTPADRYDGHSMPLILNEHTKVAVGDGTYNGSIMRRKVFEMYGTIVVAPPHPSQKKWLMTPWQEALLDMRAKVECVFDDLKEHLNLVTSFPRSVKGYLMHYVRIILAYQVAALS